MTEARAAIAPPSAVAVPLIVARHADEAALLVHQRLVLVRAPHVKLRQLRRLDDRLAAHLDGLVVAREEGSRACQAALAEAGPGEMFAAAALALDNHDTPRFDRLLAVAEAVPALREAMVLAMGWVSAQSLRGTVKELLTSPIAFRRGLGIAACVLHRADPGKVLAAALADADATLRALALRAAGDGGRRDLFASCVDGLKDEDSDCRYWAARSAALLGERYASIQALHLVAHEGGLHADDALALLLKRGSPEQVVPALRALFVERPADARRPLVKGLGTIGDPQFIPWLIDQMSDLKLARLAGESFSTITGLDLAWLDLELKPPEDIASGPNDNPENDDVTMDEDDGLPWPDPVKIQAWWHANAHDYQVGERYFMGATPSWEHCLQVRKDGFQRQRIAASEWLCLLEPGTPLFPTSAPAWRQTRWLESIHG